MKDSDNWEHRWFGVWQHEVEGLSHLFDIEYFPDVKEWSRSKDDVREDVIVQLTTAPFTSTTTEPPQPCGICGYAFVQGETWRTNGTWKWPEHVAHYIQEHSIALPIMMMASLSKATEAESIDFSSLDSPQPPRKE